MSDFALFVEAVGKQFKKMYEQSHSKALFVADTSKPVLWEMYLESFPEGTNHIYRVRREYDCSACRSFIRAVGNLIAFAPGYMNSFVTEDIWTVWDAAILNKKLLDEYRVVAKAMRDYVISCTVRNQFLASEGKAGVQKNFAKLENGTVQTWYHFFVNIPKQFVLNKKRIDTQLGDKKATHDVLKRSCEELTLDAVDTVLELISQNSLYRGMEHKKAVMEFRKLKVLFDDTPAECRDNAAWILTASNLPSSITRIRNTAIGTLLIDLSAEVSLEEAVRKFEAVVAPTNYRRPTALVSAGMVEKAKEKVEELGLTSALDRRHAVLTDISINDILFADRNVKPAIGGTVFDDIMASTSDKKPRKMDKVEEVPIDRFLADVVPLAESIEFMLENRHLKNLFSLVAPLDPTAGRLFSWDNNFSWAYNGDLADSIKERVKKAGGNVTGDVCCRLAWRNHDDLDLHMKEPDGNEIYYNNNRGYNNNKGNKSRCGGMLDVDMNAGSSQTREPVENIFYESRHTMKEGLYHLFVNQFARRENQDYGFEIEVDLLGEVLSFSYDRIMKDKEKVTALKFEYSHAYGAKILESLPTSTMSREVWGIQTGKYHRVTLAMHSPNHWENSGSGTGNKHYMFVLDGCNNPDPVRGFFNEFLRGDLNEHRKVFEIVGSKMKAEPTENQLSGVGFSSTVRDYALFRIKGKFNRIVKVLF